MIRSVKHILDIQAIPDNSIPQINCGNIRIRYSLHKQICIAVAVGFYTELLCKKIILQIFGRLIHIEQMDPILL